MRVDHSRVARALGTLRSQQKVWSLRDARAENIYGRAVRGAEAAHLEVTMSHSIGPVKNPVVAPPTPAPAHTTPSKPAPAPTNIGPAVQLTLSSTAKGDAAHGDPDGDGH